MNPQNSVEWSQKLLQMLKKLIFKDILGISANIGTHYYYVDFNLSSLEY